ncbi:MAG: TonB-dependent receptor [SAR86 cluster bacterium]|uniref:TonB-dependent receptor n=1 Tax=SAR86 cluster bacterium TaxID=2030880 RepID=A0A2A4X015_9GAMM|nr:MAG: TonB-dependent receptor [SAR86 cluster bacterium]
MPNSKTASVVLGITFIAVGIIGFIPNPLVSDTGVFVTNGVHILTGGVFLLALFMSGKESLIINTIGGAYVLVSLLGFMTSGDYMLGMIHLNLADKYLHVGLAVAILAIGKLPPNPRKVTTTTES